MTIRSASCTSVAIAGGAGSAAGWAVGSNNLPPPIPSTTPTTIPPMPNRTVIRRTSLLSLLADTSFVPGLAVIAAIVVRSYRSGISCNSCRLGKYYISVKWCVIRSVVERSQS